MSWKVGVVTISDRCSQGICEDRSGTLLSQLCQQIGGQVVEYKIIPDEQPLIEKTLIWLVDDRQCDLVLTTGGTGFGMRDVTPEATRAVIHRETPGLSEAMRRITAEKTKFAILSRAVSGIRHRTLIINFPGSPKAIRECFEAIADVLPHALDVCTRQVDHAQPEKEEGR